MRWPIFISTFCHEIIVNQLTSQVSELKAERQLLWDRLATIGLGGPIFSGPSQQDSSQSTETEEGPTDEEQEEAYMNTLKRRLPSKYAAALTSKLFRTANRVERPSVAFIPDPRMSAMLNEAEENGKKQA